MWYRCARALAWFLFWVAFRARVTGSERIPASGGLLLVSNHLSFADPLLIGWAMPRPVEFMGLAELFRVPVLGWLARKLGGFPVRRDTVDYHAVREAVRRLKQGRCVGIFAEGGIRLGTDSILSGPRPLKPGATHIALLSGATVLPVVVRNTRQFHHLSRWFRGGRMHVSFGRPFQFCTREVTAAHRLLEQLLWKTVEETSCSDTVARRDANRIVAVSDPARPRRRSA
ncbi:MAG: 1-acyl-sn-glycerol-3-phosphate acyltransferase [Verrucomicrobiae bacterium]|nr:1-acyl-sn-glycerol-3-phosphate acyltransferase [Verrucomicrobiae bacterium]MDW8342878.1 lysophospholipid acyltransferase family protein [Verrucomicrobiae bacterium]